MKKTDFDRYMTLRSELMAEGRALASKVSALKSEIEDANRRLLEIRQALFDSTMREETSDPEESPEESPEELPEESSEELPEESPEELPEDRLYELIKLSGAAGETLASLCTLMESHGYDESTTKRVCAKLRNQGVIQNIGVSRRYPVYRTA